MSNSTDTPRPEPEREVGYTANQIKDVLNKRLPELWPSMIGRTQTICDGSRYAPESKRDEPTDCGPHRAIVNPRDPE